MDFNYFQKLYQNRCLLSPRVEESESQPSLMMIENCCWNASQ